MTLTIQTLLPPSIHDLVYYDRPLIWLAYRDGQPVLLIAHDEAFDPHTGVWSFDWIEYLMQPDDIRALARGTTQPGRAPYNELFDRMEAFWLHAEGPSGQLVCTRAPVTPEQREQARFTEHGDSIKLEPRWMTEGLELGWEEPFAAGTARPPPPV